MLSQILTDNYKLSSRSPCIVELAEVHSTVLYLCFIYVERGVLGVINVLKFNPFSLYLCNVVPHVCISFVPVHSHWLGPEGLIYGTVYSRHAVGF